MVAIVFLAPARAASDTPAPRVPPARDPFVHPGLLHNREDLAFIRDRVTRGE